MDGKYLSDSYPFTAKHKVIINKWIQNAIDTKNWEERLDIHVDEICRDGHYKKYWIPLSISLAHQANRCLSEMKQVDIIGIVEIPLYADEKAKMGFPFQKIEDIKRSFDVTPPSLSVYPKECTALANVYQKSLKLGSLFIDETPFDALAYEVFFKKDYIHHMRVISLVPAGHKIKLST